MCGIVTLLVFIGVAGYVLVHLSRTKSLQPSWRATRTASSSSAIVAIPVEIIIGFPVAATFRIRGISAFSKHGHQPWLLPQRFLKRGLTTDYDSQTFPL